MTEKAKNWKPFPLTAPTNARNPFVISRTPQADADKTARIAGKTITRWDYGKGRTR